jgi:hypothetical protein
MKRYEFSTLYTTIPQEKLKSRLFDFIDKCFFKKKWGRKYPYLVISLQKHYFVKSMGSILFLKNGFKKLAEKTIKIISEVIIMRYVQL